jgi:GNAT superfamily N-acetyltransferase
MPLDSLTTGYSPESDASNRLMEALQRNQRWWLLRVGAAGGESIHRRKGVIWFDAPTATSAMYVPFPRLTPTNARHELDALIATIGDKQAPRPVWLWAAAPPEPANLPLLLMARGFRHGFQPHWMWLDLATLRDDFVLRRDIRIELNPDPAIWDPVKNADFLAECRLARLHPDRAVQAVAWVDGAPIGVSCAFLTRGQSGIAGIYDVGVLPEYRNQGIGKALTHAVCVWARDRGYRIAGLNATPMGEPVYRALGFQSLRWSETWHYPVEVQRQPPLPEQVALVEAIGTGAIAALEENAASFSPFMNAMLPCRRTPLQLAALFAQPQSARWLLDRGAHPDVLAYWGLGWAEETRALVASRPETVNQRAGDWGQTPLHEAAMRGDVALMRLLIDAGADLEARDETFRGRPLEWSKHFGQSEAERLLESAMR